MISFYLRAVLLLVKIVIKMVLQMRMIFNYDIVSLLAGPPAR